MHTAGHWRNKEQSDQCKIKSDGVLIDSGTLANILGGIIIWNPWSNESDANLECCYSSQLTIVRVIKKMN